MRCHRRLHRRKKRRLDFRCATYRGKGLGTFCRRNTLPNPAYGYHGEGAFACCSWARRPERIIHLGCRAWHERFRRCVACVFSELSRRGLDFQAVRTGVMDDLPGLERRFAESFPKSVTDRCWVHAMRNADENTPARIRPTFKTFALEVLYAGSEKCSSQRPRPVEKSDVERSRARRALPEEGFGIALVSRPI